MNINKELLKICTEKGFLLDKNLLEKLSCLDESLSKNILIYYFNLNIKDKIITKQLLVENSQILIKFFERDKNKDLVINFLNSLGEFKILINKEKEVTQKINQNNSVKIISSPIIFPKKITVQDFVSHFRSRYEQIRAILLEKNIENLKSLRRISKERETYYIIISVLNKKITKNGNILLEVEDLNGIATVLINNNKKDLFEKAKDILLDEVIALGVSGNNEILFANDIIYPDSVLSEKKNMKNEELVAFTSDLHIGSTMFLENNFLKFIKWLNCEEGDIDQKKLAKKVKYLFIVGDSVDGVGVYPDQEKFLNINDMFEQYKKLGELLKKIRQDINIIICPGQHDAVWVGEPQPPLNEKWAPDVVNMPNVILVTNPSVVEISGGFKILMYHGASMHGIIEEIEEIRTKYGHESPTRVTKEMLKRRHLSPIHGSCDYIPNEKKDLMVINHLPDLVFTGDQHKPEVSFYNNILLISSSCWQEKTPFEEKVGHNPEPCKVPLYNLKTREVKILDFS